MPQGKNCRETVFASHLSRNYPHRGSNFERAKDALSRGRETVWEAFQETIWARAIASQKLPRDSGETICATRHSDVSQALWVRVNQSNPSQRRDRKIGNQQNVDTSIESMITEILNNEAFSICC